MNPKSVVILLVVLLMGIAALLLTRPGASDPSPNGNAEGTGELIIDADLIDSGIISIRIGSGLNGFQPLLLERSAGRWQVIEPHAFLANTEPIDQLLGLIASLEGEPTEKYNAFVPDNPGLTIGNDNHSITLYFGERLGAGMASVAIVNGGATTNWIVDNALHDLFDTYFERGGRTAFYARKVEPLLMPEYNHIELISEKSTSALIQPSPGEWQVLQGKTKAPALTEQLGEYPGIANLFELHNSIKPQVHIEYFRAEALSQYGLDRPLISVRFIPVDADPNNIAASLSLNVGVPADPKDENRYVSYGRSDDPRPAVFTLATPIALAFGQQATNFRDPRIMETPLTLIETIALKLPDASTQTIALPASEPPSWTVQGQAPRTLSTERAVAMLKSLTDARAIAYVPVLLGEWDALISVLITHRLGGQAELFTIYPDPESDPAEPTVLVHRAKEPVVLRVPRSSVEGLLDPELLVAPR